MARNFEAQNFFFSNNDCFLVAIGRTDMHIIDVRTGAKVFFRKFNPYTGLLENTYEESEKSEKLTKSQAEEFDIEQSEISSSSTESVVEDPTNKTNKGDYRWSTITK